MSGITLTADLEGEAGVLGALTGLLQRLTHKQPLMEIFGAYLRTSTRERFDTQLAPDGTPWKPSVRAQLRGGQTLVDHRILRDSYHEDFGEDFAAVGTADVRAGTFQFGRTKPEMVQGHSRRITQAFGRRLRFPVFQTVEAHSRNPNIVARPMLGLSAEDRIEIPALAEDYFGEVLP